VLRHPPIAHSEPEPLGAVDPRTRSTEAPAQDPPPRKNNFVWSFAPRTPNAQSILPDLWLKWVIEAVVVQGEITRRPRARDEAIIWQNALLFALGSRHSWDKQQCPLYPLKRTLICTTLMSAYPQKRAKRIERPALCHNLCLELLQSTMRL